MGESKVDGAVDELLLGDGFSIVDSTKGDGGDAKDGKKKSSSSAAKTEKKSSEVKKEASSTTSSTSTKEKAPEKSTSEKSSSEKSSSEKTAPEKPAPASTTEEKKPENPPASTKEEAAEKEAPVKPEPTASPIKDESKTNGLDVKSDALLITTEEDLELTDKDKKTKSETKKEEKPKKEESSSFDKRKQGDVWVSNITRNVKATDLKRHFIRHGKVLTAKIVTNGQAFFGYILMENADVANKCVRVLQGTTLDGRKIGVSRQRPDQRKMERNKPTVKGSRNEKKPEKRSGDKKSEKSGDSKKDDALVAMKRNEDRLRRECDYLKREVARLKRTLADEQRRNRIEQQKTRSLGRELQEIEGKLRDERRKMERERDLFEKNQRTDRVKMENDRSLIKKELEEVKKLREYLKRKLEEEQARPREVERRPRAVSPYAYSSKRFRESSGADRDKSSKYVEERTRTPPSPPKLSSRSKRSPVNSFSVDKDRRGGPSHHYNMSEREDVNRHSSSMVIAAKPSTPAAPRNIWPSFHQEVWRVPPSATTSAPFASSQTSYPRQSDYGSNSSTNKTQSYSQQRDFSKRDHYNSSSVRKY